MHGAVQERCSAMLPRTSRGRWPPTYLPWTPEAAPNIHPPRKERASLLPHDTHTQGCWGMGGGAFPPIQKPLPTLPGLSLGGGGAGGVPVCPAHPLPLPLTLQLLTADHSLSLRKDIQTFHFPFCLVLGPASAPDGYPAPPPHSPTPRHPGTHGFITSHWAFPGLAKHPANHTDTGSRPAMGAEVEMV